jgi:hypothetical protein
MDGVVKPITGPMRRPHQAALMMITTCHIRRGSFRAA